jgi:hypothetical protein
VVRALNAPFSLVVVAGGWPSELIAVLSLGLILLGAYFPSKFHWYFKPKGGLTTWFVPSDVKSTVVPEEVGILVLGSPAFICRIFAEIGPTRRLIILVLPHFCDATPRGLWKDQAAAKALLSCHNLHPVSFPDADNGGATDACLVFGFGNDLGSTCLPGLTMGLLQTLRHFLEGGTKGFFSEFAQVPCLSVPDITAPPRKVLWHLDVVLGEGLSLAPDRNPWYYAPPTSSRGIGSTTRFPFLNYCGCPSCLCLWTCLCELCLHIRACLLRTLRPLTCLSLSFDSYGE